MSQIEASAFLYLDYHPDLVDVREQFFHMPIESTVALCREMGVTHPYQRGRIFPLSTDFLATRRDGRLLAIEMKSRPDDLSERDRELIAVKKVWWEARKIEYLVAYRSDLNRDVANNILQILHHLWKHREQKTLPPLEVAEALLEAYTPDLCLTDILEVVRQRRFPTASLNVLHHAFLAALGEHHLFVNLRRRLLLIHRIEIVKDVAAAADWPW